MAIHTMGPPLVEQLITSLNVTTAQRDKALADLIDLQRMLGADKACAVLCLAFRQSALSSLHRWRAAVSDMLTRGLRPALRSTQHAAEAAAAEAAARLEAEESRRVQAERLVFDEGKRRRKAEEEAARLSQLRLASRAQLGEAVAQALFVWHERRDLTWAVAMWRIGMAAVERECSERHEAMLEAKLADAERAAHESAEKRAHNDLAAKGTAEQLSKQLRQSQREASELQLNVLTARQQRAEALAKAAAEEQSRLEIAADAERMEDRHKALVEKIGNAHVKARLGVCFTTWGRFAATRSASVNAQASGNAAAAFAEAARRQQAEAAAADIAAHAAEAAAARADGERLAAQSEMRRTKSEQARAAERRRHTIELTTLLAAELRATEAQLSRVTLFGERMGSRLGLLSARKEEEAGAIAAVRAWAAEARKAKREAQQRQLVAVRSAMAEEANRSSKRLKVIEGTRSYSAELLWRLRDRKAISWAISQWRSASFGYIVLDASVKRQSELEQALESAAREHASLQKRMDAESSRAEAAEAAAEEMKKRLESTEAAAKEVEERAKLKMQEAERLEEEYQAAKLRDMLKQEQAEREAERFRQSLTAELQASPIRGGGRSREGSSSNFASAPSADSTHPFGLAPRMEVAPKAFVPNVPAAEPNSPSPKGPVPRPPTESELSIAKSGSQWSAADEG